MERFWSKVEKSDGCWLWRGASLSTGYGCFSGPGGKTLKAHRVSYQMTNGDIPPGMSVLHTCDVRLCVRPDHLWIGTKADNNRDMIAKGRQLRGSVHQNAKLTDDQVAEIRAAEGTLREIASRYSVSHATIGRIRRGQSY